MYTNNACLIYAICTLTLTTVSLLDYTFMTSGKFAKQKEEEVARSLGGKSRKGFVSKHPFTGLAEVTDPLLPSETAFYWQIPRSGGTTLKYVLSNCLNLVQASRASKDHCDVRSDQLQICPTLNVGTLINIDPSDDHGIRRAAEMKLVESGMVDVIISSRFLHLSSIFDESHKARTFTVIRDPIERSISTFYYLQEAQWERHYNTEFKGMTLLEYAHREATSSDWMIRWLTGKNSDPVLTRTDLNLAKEILQRKFLILLTDDMPTSVARLIQYMKWELTDEQVKCVKQNVEKVRSHNQNVHPKVLETSPEYKAFQIRNKWDIELYEYAKQLFIQQGEFFKQQSKPKKNS